MLNLLLELLESEWPTGEYALPMSMFGCPEEETRGWQNGFINLTIPVTAPNHEWNDDDLETTEPNILGPYYKHSIQLNFCTKTEESYNHSMKIMYWPNGSYCIYRIGATCPIGGLKQLLTILRQLIQMTCIQVK